MEIETLSSDSSTLIHHHHRQNHRDTAATAVGVVQCEESGESSSSPPELELGLGLSLGCGNRIQKNNVQIPRIFTANQLNNNNNTNNNSSSINNNNVSSNGGGVVVSPPSSASSSLALKTGDGGVCVGSKRAASPTALSQVVGWPPIRSYRMNSMAKSIANSENDTQFDETKGKKLIYDADNKGNAANSKEKSGHKSSLFVKVNMDGVAIGRKVDLASHSSYVSLARTLEEMFTNNDDGEKANAEELILMPKVTRPSKLLDGSSDFVITYEDKDGDWMLVGDVPWGMFVTSVKRLKIMRTSEANGLAPRSEDRSSKQKRRPI